MVVALLTGVATGVSGPSEMSAVRSVVPPEQLSTALSQSQARQHVGALLGGPLGGILYGVTRWLPFAFDAVSFAAYWLLAGRLRTDLSAPRTTGRGVDRARTWRKASASSSAGRTSAPWSCGRRWSTCW